MSDNNDIIELKSEISWYYIEELKQELGWLKSLTLLPIKNKVKDIIMWKWELPDKFKEIKEFWRWKDIIDFVTPSTAEKIYKFMKEKREELVQLNTKEELETLKNEIITKLKNKNLGEIEGAGESIEADDWSKKDWDNWDNANDNSNWKKDTEDKQKNNPDDNKSEGNPKTVWIITGWAWLLSARLGTQYYLSAKNSKELSKVWKEVDWKKIKSTVEALINTVENQNKALKWQLSDKQIKNIDNQIKNIKKWLSSFWDDWLEAFKAWQQLWDRLPMKALEKMGIWPENIKALEWVVGDLKGMNTVDEIKNYLKEKNIIPTADIDKMDDFRRVLAECKEEKEIKSLLRIAWNAQEVKNIAKTVWSALMFDLAFLWIDVWVFMEMEKEADLIAKVNSIRAQNKYKQANTQLVIGVVSAVADVVLAWALAWTASAWVIWTIVWLWIWAVAAAASMGVDSLYFDVQDFYLQNKADFLRKTRSEVNQAILQCLHNKEKGNTTINENIWAPGLEQRIQCTNDAIRAAIFLDEVENWQFKWSEILNRYLGSWKNYLQFEDMLDKEPEAKKEFQETRKKINEIIDTRMNYISKLHSWIVKELKPWNGINALDKAVIESRVYVKLKEDKDYNRDENKTYEENLEQNKQKFFEGINKEKLSKIENLKKSHPELYQEIIATTDEEILIWSLDWWELWENEVPTYWTKDKDKYFNLRDYVKAVSRYKEWLDLTQSNGEKINLNVSYLDKHYHFIQELFINDLDPDKVDMSYDWWDDSVINSINWWYERSWYLEISDDVLQNVLYRLWKELYWYTWINEKSEIMSFYDEWHDAIHWLYFSDKWMVNIDNNTDAWLITKGIEWPFNTDEEVKNYVDKFIKSNFYYENTDEEWRTTYTPKPVIDTKTENIDKDLQKEFERKIKEILTEELTYRLKENTESVKQEILEFVKKHSTTDDDYFIKIPYYLVLKARRAWLWDLQTLYFRRKNDSKKIEVCGLPYDTFTKKLPFDENQIIRSYVSSYRKLENETLDSWSSNDVYTQEEKFYIDRVERAHQLVENLRSCQWFWTKLDELDLPVDVGHIISDKWKEWNRFKRNLLARWKYYAATTDVITTYEQYAEYFENLYKWLLLLETTFKISNDTDKFDLYKDALHKWGQNCFDVKWQLKDDTGLDFINNKKIRQFYSEQIQKQQVKVWDTQKTIQELRNIQEPNENSNMTQKEYKEMKDLALQASNVIITAMLEESMLEKDDKGNITSINIWWHRFDSDNNDAADWEKAKQKTEELIKERLKPLNIPPAIDVEKIKGGDQKIITLNDKQKASIKKSIDITKYIENTMPELDWRWKRNAVVYDPEKSTINSRNNEVKVTIEDKWWKTLYYIEHLDIWFENIGDFVRMANFRNWLKYENLSNHYYWINIEFKANKLRTPTFVRDNTTLIGRDTLISNCSICESDANMTKLTNWLNNELSDTYDPAWVVRGQEWRDQHPEIDREAVTDPEYDCPYTW